jgi:predicted porin
MQKKLIAVAVAGVLGAPAVALAQTSTVNIYGNITYEYGWADQGPGRPSVDYADSPGGSAIGFRGEEKLGGGLSAWFQCESSADVRAMDQTGWCMRNSAIGLRGGFGNLHFGRWDTPMKRAMNQGTVGAEETGILGMSFLAFGGSGGADATESADGIQRQRWKRREAGLSYYESPVFNGFQVLAAISTGNKAADQAATDNTTNAKSRVWSIGATYSSGPLALGAGYEAHNDFGPFNGANDLDDKGWGVSAAYTFGGNIKVGGTWLRREWETAPGRDVKTDTFTIGVNWAIQGPHGFEAQYTWADDCDGNSLTGIGGNGGCNAPRRVVGGVEQSVGDTGAQAFSLAYTYRFSKRTRLKLAYVVVDNDSNSNRARIGNTAATLRTGEKLDAFGFHINHRF